ncbi:unnamed protein product [Photorhabdus laumondii subsp. laumondii TTO1]|uniref:Photorhabdus luminescens subsp. laumondii TTO1 complete genome segment 14/17 n=1 Tax=Photorhabdus laumondii subsp. laumondii (strain DSM 15139 / CIP 105565 / TT01) TaxID=243265 RepID=Q7MZW0_PHOLL|nr:unnamed protein product [Photorhabdus laumondii subsp. laumondii TTO1]
MFSATRTAILNGELETQFGRWYPRVKLGEETENHCGMKTREKSSISKKNSTNTTNLSMPVPYLDLFFLVESSDLGTGA